MEPEKFLKNKGERKNRNVDGIFFVPKIKKFIEEKKPIPTYSDILNIIEKKKPNKKQKIIIALCAIFVFAIIPIKLLNTGNSLKAYAQNSIEKMDDLYKSIGSNDLERARTDLFSLQKDIEYIQKELTKLGQRNIFISKFSSFKGSGTNTENILDIASSTLKIGTTLADDILYFRDTGTKSVNSNGNNEELFSRIKDLNKRLSGLDGEIKNLELSIKSIDEKKLNGKEKEYFTFLKENSKDITSYYKTSLNLTAILPGLLGENVDKKYLILFQNDTELRPTGGFIGSYGIVTMRDAKIKKIMVDSIYNPDGQLLEKIEPPAPLKKVTDNLAMRDANWNPNFPDSARLITQLYEKEGGFTPDGIIAVDTNLFLDLLNITGPIKLEKYGVEINRDNFVNTTQYKTSIDYDPEANNPKKFLADFAPIFMDKVFSLEKEKQMEVLRIIAQNIQEKHLQFYSFDQSLQDIFSELNIAGEIKNTEGDYFSYINANIGGLKTNDKIKESLVHNISIDKDGYLIHEVILTRTHEGSYEWPSGVNYSYIRFYAPKGSQVLEIENFEKNDAIKKNIETGMIYLEDKSDKYPGRAETKDIDTSQQNEKTVFGVWQVVKPGEKIVSRIKYKTPVKLDSSEYKLLIQKQAGIRSQETTINFTNKDKQTTKNLNLSKDELLSLEIN